MAELYKKYNCPGCHCGSMFEYNHKVVCLNCGKEYPKALAAAATHTHEYETNVDRPLPKIATSAPDRNARQSGVTRTYQQTSGFTQNDRRAAKNKAKNPIIAGVSFIIYLLIILSAVRGCMG